MKNQQNGERRETETNKQIIIIKKKARKVVKVNDDDDDDVPLGDGRAGEGRGASDNNKKGSKKNERLHNKDAHLLVFLYFFFSHFS
jgi:hypothetical protein